MKVLWFSNTPANADEYFNSELKGTGGWLKALDQALQKHVDLHIAFYKESSSAFKYGETTYYPIKSNESIYRRLINRYTGKIIDNEDLDKYLSIIENVKPNIIHIHGTESPFGCIIPHVDIPVVVSIQGIITVIYHKYLGGFEKRLLKINDREPYNLKSILLPKSFRYSYRHFKQMQIREERNLQNAKFIIGRTVWDKRTTRILAPNSNYYHGDEILRNSFYGSVWKLHNRTKTIIHTTTGNNTYKGFETICLAAHQLSKQNVDFEWQVAGLNSNELIVKMTKKKLGKHYPKRRLIFLGSLNEVELVEALKCSDLYVMPSHIENGCNALSEAMILGMPCISSFSGGTGTTINDSVNGILIQSGDPWAMAGAVLELVNDKEGAVELGRNARKTALRRHNKGRIVKELTRTYENIVNIHRTTSKGLESTL